MTLNELKRNVDYWISCGWGDEYVYSADFEPIEIMDVVEGKIEDPCNPDYVYESILIIQ